MSLRNTILVTAVSVTLGSTLGCTQLTATTFAVALITSTPDLATNDDPVLAAIGASAVPAAAAAVVGVGERDSVTSTSAPSAVSGATVDVGYNDTTVALAAGSSAGSYEASSASGANLVYDVGVEYRTTIRTSTNTYTLKVTAPDAIPKDDIVFAPALVAATVPLLYSHPRNSDLTVDWSAAAGASQKHVFVTLLRINFSGNPAVPTDLTNSANWDPDPQNPVYQNLPTGLSAMLDFVTQTPPTSVVLPAATLSTGTYVLLVIMADIDGDVSSNLSLGSSSLAGRATAFVFMVE